jgi:4-amino-4-deoxy-L-arabinose transferase-like glycosyltransferase
LSSTRRPSPTSSGRARSALLLGLLGLMLAQAASTLSTLSTTPDETSHLPAGYSYWVTRDFRLNPQHPPLVKLLAAVPLLAMDVRFDRELPAWRQDPPLEWQVGYQFLYGNGAERLLLPARAVMLLLGLALAVYAFLWARALFGPGAGLLALGLAAFSPNLLAHTRLVTTDVALALFHTAALYHAWRYLRGAARGQLLAAGAATGLALASKYSGLLLLPSLALLFAYRAWQPADPAQPPAARARRAALDLAIVAGLALAVVQISYLLSPDPTLYWRGLLQVNADRNPAHAFYLMGEFRSGGWWYYLPVAFLVKTPIPTLLLLGAALGLALRGERGAALDELCLLVPAALFTGAMCATSANLGLRYLLPVYPLLFVLASRVARAAPQARWARAALAALALWYAGGTLWIHPHYLSYFNELAGGPARGHLWLDDSNLDWGQDLARLGRYLEEHDIERIKLRTSPVFHPESWGVRWEPISDHEWAYERPPGLYAISAQLLIRGEHHARQTGEGTDWLSRYEPVARIGYSIYLFRFD